MTRESLQHLLSVLFVLIAALSGATLLRAQTADTGALTGTVTDSSGGVLSNAEVTAISEATGAQRTAKTGANGDYRIPLLPPGSYRIEARSSGFKLGFRPGVQIAVTETARLNIQLEVGSVTEEVTVSAAEPLLQAESAALGHPTSGDEILAMPLANRNFTQILALSTGVSVDLPDAGAVGKNNQNVSDNGARVTENNFQFNGIDANNIANNSASGTVFGPQAAGMAVPAPDTIAEFKVQTGLYDASQGRSPGAIVDVVSKSGTNSWHGTLWEFFRNDALNANDFFLNAAKLPRPVLKQNQFGGVLGGPIRKDKDFFFIGYQGTIQRNGESSLGFQTAFLPPQLTNDRSAAALGSAFGGQSGAFGGTAVAPDGSNINPVALSLLNFKFANGQYVIPTPQRIIQTPGGPLGEFIYSAPVKYREDQYTVNLDHYFSSRDQLSAKFFESRAPQVAPFIGFATNLPGWPNTVENDNVMAILSETHTTSKFANVARLGYTRFFGSQIASEPIQASDVGITSAEGFPQIPVVELNGLFSIGAWQDSSGITNTYIAQDTVAFTSGKHNLRLGAEVKHAENKLSLTQLRSGVMLFLSFPDFLLGQSGSQNGSGVSNVFLTALEDGPLAKDVRYIDTAAFVQDDYKVTSRLTLNLGLRHEFFGPPSEAHGLIGFFNPALTTPVPPAGGTLTGTEVVGNYAGPFPAGVTKSSSTAAWNKSYKDFAPRVGFALRLRDKPGLVLRGGYGIFYSVLSAAVPLQTIIGLPFNTIFIRVAPAAPTFQVPFNPAPPPISSFPQFAPRTSNPNSDLSEIVLQQNMNTPYVQQYGLNLQYEFAPNFLLEVGYVGSKGTHLPGQVGYNQAEIATPQHPVNGETTTTLADVLQRTPFLGADPVTSTALATPFFSNYNSLQASVTKRLSHGLLFLASYTWSKSLDGFSGGFADSGTPSTNFSDVSSAVNDQANLRNSYGPSDFSRTHRFSGSFVYRPPVFQHGPRPLQSLLSRWEFSGLTVLQSGLPITIIDSVGGTAYGGSAENGGVTAECTGKVQITSGSVTSRLNNYFNRAAFAPAPIIGDDGLATGFGNCGRGTVRGPSELNLDAAVQRSFPVFRESSLLFRAEFFNATNTPKFGFPGVDVSTPSTFGVITSSVASPRIIQFALKYSF